VKELAESATCVTSCGIDPSRISSWFCWERTRSMQKTLMIHLLVSTWS